MLARTNTAEKPGWNNFWYILLYKQIKKLKYNRYIDSRYRFIYAEYYRRVIGHTYILSLPAVDTDTVLGKWKKKEPDVCACIEKYAAI